MYKTLKSFMGFPYHADTFVLLPSHVLLIENTINKTKKWCLYFYDKILMRFIIARVNGRTYQHI